MPTLVSIQIGAPQRLGVEGAADLFERPWTTGIYKVPVSGPLDLGEQNLAGDAQADLSNHGGPDKAVCAYSADHYAEWTRDPDLVAMAPGAFGENFTIRGLTESDVCIGDVWAVGDALIQVSQPRQPCWKLARKWGIRDFAERVVQSGRTGWYFRVVRPGRVAPATEMTLVDRSAEQWTIAAANRVMHSRPVDVAASAILAALPALAGSWRHTLAGRASARR